MAADKLVLDGAFDLCTGSLQWRMLKEQANIYIHTLECINYKYFFTETYPCLQGYQDWTDKMVDIYLNRRGRTCKYYLPELDASVLRYWEGVEYEGALVRWYDQEEIGMPRRLHDVKYKIEHDWNFVRHLAEEILIHNEACCTFKTTYGKFGCLKEFINWDFMTLHNFIKHKNECTFK